MEKNGLSQQEKQAREALDDKAPPKPPKPQDQNEVMKAAESSIVDCFKKD